MHLTPLQQISKIYDPFNFFDFIYHSYNTGQKHYPPTPIAIYIQEGMQFVSLYFDTTDIIQIRANISFVVCVKIHIFFIIFLQNDVLNRLKIAKISLCINFPNQNIISVVSKYNDTNCIPSCIYIAIGVGG
jgi:hypothetical protein